MSLPTESVKSVEIIILDKVTDQSFLGSKSTTELSQVFTLPERTNLSKSAQNPSQPSSTSFFPQNQNTQSVQIPITYSPTFVIPTVPIHTIVLPHPPIAMAARFTLLVFPAQLHDLPQGYSQIIRTYGEVGDISSQQHLDRFNDFCAIEEVDYEDAKMRLFAQIFYGEVKKWFRGLTARSIHNFQEFEIVFLRKWERNKDSLHLLTWYNNLKRGPIEYVQDFSSRFMRSYDSIPADVKPSLGAAKLHYVDAFSSEFTLLLRERRSVSLTDMMDDAIEVEVNLTTSNKTK